MKSKIKISLTSLAFTPRGLVKRAGYRTTISYKIDVMTAMAIVFNDVLPVICKDEHCKRYSITSFSADIAQDCYCFSVNYINDYACSHTNIDIEVDLDKYAD